MPTRPKRRDPAVVSYTMSRIRSTDTGIERRLRYALWAKGFRYRKNYRRLIGTPDIVFVGKKVAVFCDSSFWHGRRWQQLKKRLKSNRDYWIAKIERNKARDRRVNRSLRRKGWVVIRFWDVDIEQKLPECVKRVSEALSNG